MDLSEMLAQAQNGDPGLRRQLLVSISRLINSHGLNDRNADIFLELLASGQSTVADELFAHRTPLAFLANIRLDQDRVRRVLAILIASSPTQIEARICLACFGYLSRLPGEMQQKTANLALSVSDIQHLAKYLLAAAPAISEQAAGLLGNIASRGNQLPGSIREEAGKLLDCYQDSTKSLRAALPTQLLP